MMIKKRLQKLSFLFVFLIVISGCNILDKDPKTIDNQSITLDISLDTEEEPIEYLEDHLLDEKDVGIAEKDIIVEEQENEEIVIEVDVVFEVRPPIDEALKQIMIGNSYNENEHIGYENLRHVMVGYIDFDGLKQQGELVVNEAIAETIKDIFYELYTLKYPIEKKYN